MFQDMQLASLKALTSICVSAQKARSHPISIASYISTLDQVSHLHKLHSIDSYFELSLHAANLCSSLVVSLHVI